MLYGNNVDLQTWLNQINSMVDPLYPFVIKDTLSHQSWDNKIDQIRRSKERDSTREDNRRIQKNSQSLDPQSKFWNTFDKVYPLTAKKDDIPVNLFVGETTVQYQFLVPGIPKENVSVKYDLEKLVVTISGKREAGKLSQVTSEFAVPTVTQRTVTFLKDSLNRSMVDLDAPVTANVKDGVLTVTFSLRQSMIQPESLKEVNLS